MDTRNRAPTPTPGDLFPPEVMQLLSTAQRVIDQHVSYDGNCAECGSIWPCQCARLAESALATL